MAKLQFKGSTGEGFALPPEGTFDLYIEEVKDGAVSKQGDPQVVCKFSIAGGPHDGVKFKQWYTLNDDRGWEFEKLLEATGIDFEKVEGAEGEPPDMSVDTDELLYAYFRATVKLNPSNDGKKTFVNLREYQPSELSDQNVGAGDDGGDEEGEPEPETAQAASTATTTAATAAPANGGPPAARRRPRPNTTNA